MAINVIYVHAYEWCVNNKAIYTYLCWVYTWGTSTLTLYPSGYKTSSLDKSLNLNEF